MRRLGMALAVGLVLGLAWMASARAQGNTPQVVAGETIRTVLAQRLSKTVTLQLDSGEEITGSVRSIGDRVVQLEKLAGREFFDAYVELEDVAAVLVRAR